MHTYHFTRASGNEKTGPIPVTTSSKSTCPSACPLRGHGCYAEYGPLSMHWHQVSIGNRGIILGEVCSQVKKLPKHQLWRWAQAGDLPGDSVEIDEAGLDQIVQANTNRNGFTFTHYAPEHGHNATAIAEANALGFTVNLSANSLAHADQLAALGIGPVVTVLPSDTTKPLKTPEGRHVSVCPATVRDDIQCASCGICANATRKAIIGFPAHGSGAKKAQQIFFQPPGNKPTTLKAPYADLQDHHRPVHRQWRLLASQPDRGVQSTWCAEKTRPQA